MEEFNVWWTPKLSVTQLNLACITRNKKSIKKKLKQTNASAHLVRYRLRSVLYCVASSVIQWWCVVVQRLAATLRRQFCRRRWQTQWSVTVHRQWQSRLVSRTLRPTLTDHWHFLSVLTHVDPLDRWQTVTLQLSADQPIVPAPATLLYKLSTRSRQLQRRLLAAAWTQV